MQLNRDHNKEAMLPHGSLDQHWIALCPLAVIRVYQRDGVWHWKIITSRAVPFISRENLKTKDAAWADARKWLAKLTRGVLAELEAAEEAAPDAD